MNKERGLTMYEQSNEGPTKLSQASNCNSRKWKKTLIELKWEIDARIVQKQNVTQTSEHRGAKSSKIESQRSMWLIVDLGSLAFSVTSLLGVVFLFFYMRNKLSTNPSNSLPEQEIFLKQMERGQKKDELSQQGSN